MDKLILDIQRYLLYTDIYLENDITIHLNNLSLHTNISLEDLLKLQELKNKREAFSKFSYDINKIIEVNLHDNK